MFAPSASAPGVPKARQGAVQSCPFAETPTESSVQNRLTPRNALLHLDVCSWCACSQARSGSELPPPSFRRQVHRKQCVENTYHAICVPSAPVPSVRAASQRVAQSHPPHKESPPKAGRSSRRRRKRRSTMSGMGKEKQGTRKRSMSWTSRKSRQIRRSRETRKKRGAEIAGRAGRAEEGGGGGDCGKGGAGACVGVSFRSHPKTTMVS